MGFFSSLLSMLFALAIASVNFGFFYVLVIEGVDDNFSNVTKDSKEWSYLQWFTFFMGMPVILLGVFIYRIKQRVYAVEA